MRFIKVVLFDIKNGILKNKFLFISTIVFALFVCSEFCIKAHFIGEAYNFQAVLGDYFCYVYGGMKEVRGQDFSLPVVWLLALTLPAFSVLNYPLNDLQGVGSHIIYRTRNRNLWWFSKCVWNALTTISFHVIVLGFISIFAMFTKTPMELNLSEEVFIFIHKLSADDLTETTLVFNFSLILAPILISISINLLQMLLSLFIKPLFSFLCISVILISSAFKLTPFFIGNFAMQLRSDMIIKEGLSIEIGLIVSSLIILVSLIIGLLSFKQYDILNKE